MSLSLQNLRDELREHLGVDSTDLDDVAADRLLNRSWWQVADDFDFKEKETSRTYNTVIGTLLYASAADINGLQAVAIEDPYSQQHDLLDPMTLLVYESGFVDNINARGKPRKYVTKGNAIILYPTPDKVYEITEHYWKTLADLVVGGPTIPQAWHEIILMGAVQRGFIRDGDYSRANGARSLKVELLNTKESRESKEKADRPYAGLKMLRPRYP